MSDAEAHGDGVQRMAGAGEPEYGKSGGGEHQKRNARGTNTSTIKFAR